MWALVALEAAHLDIGPAANLVPRDEGARRVDASLRELVQKLHHFDVVVRKNDAFEPFRLIYDTPPPVGEAPEALK